MDQLHDDIPGPNAITRFSFTLDTSIMVFARGVRETLRDYSRQFLAADKNDQIVKNRITYFELLDNFVQYAVLCQELLTRKKPDELPYLTDELRQPVVVRLKEWVRLLVELDNAADELALLDNDYPGEFSAATDEVHEEYRTRKSEISARIQNTSMMARLARHDLMCAVS